jgi:hypothetical protein
LRGRLLAGVAASGLPVVVVVVVIQAHDIFLGHITLGMLSQRRFPHWPRGWCTALAGGPEHVGVAFRLHFCTNAEIDAVHS